MTREEAIKELQKCKWLIQHGGQDYLDERDIPLLDMAIEALSAEPSEQYKKGFEDAKRAFELKYARESENMRKRNAQLEVLLNAQKAIAEPCKSTEQNVADVPSGDLISRADAIEMLLSFKESRAKGVSTYDIGFVDGLSHAINMIDLVPSAEYSKPLQTTLNGDLISRQDALMELNGVCSNWQDDTKVAEIIKALPSAEKKEGEYADEIARRIATIIENEQDMRVILESADRPKGDPETEPAPVVAYICDRRRCAICSGPDGGCDHTTDIKHAAHFKNVAGQYFERTYMEEEEDE